MNLDTDDTKAKYDLSEIMLTLMNSGRKKKISEGSLKGLRGWEVAAHKRILTHGQWSENENDLFSFPALLKNKGVPHTPKDLRRVLEKKKAIWPF
ncbi:MAG: hypothetical protein AAFY71_16880 [Bacteroidota bacterium]